MESIRQIVRRYHDSGVLLVFIVIDNPKVYALLCFAHVRQAAVR